MSTQKHKSGSSRRRTLIMGAVIAGVLALSGGGYAVAHGMVGSPEIRDGGVRSPDINDKDVTKRKLSDFVQSQLEKRGPKGEQGEPGADGTNGTDGADGTDGQDGQDGVASPEVDGTYHDLPGDDNAVQTFTVDCAGDKVATGGGFSIDFPQHRDNVIFVGSTPANFTPIEGDPEGSVVARGWEVQVINNGPATSLRTWVACAEIAA